MDGTAVEWVGLEWQGSHGLFGCGKDRHGAAWVAAAERPGREGQVRGGPVRHASYGMNGLARVEVLGWVRLASLGLDGRGSQDLDWFGEIWHGGARIGTQGTPA